DFARQFDHWARDPCQVKRQLRTYAWPGLAAVEHRTQSLHRFAHPGQRNSHLDSERRVAFTMPGAEAENKSSAGKFLDRRGFIGEQMRMAQINVRDRGAEVDSLGVQAERERACERVVVRLGH